MSRRFGLWAVLLWVGCDGGPISDWPRGSSSNDRGGPNPGAGNGDQAAHDDGSAPPGLNGSTGTGGTGGAGEGINTGSAGSPDDAQDAGAVCPGAPMSDGGAQDAPDASAQDAGTPSDAGAGEVMCAPPFCGLRLLDLTELAAPGGACTDDEGGLASICSGALPAAAYACAQSLATSGVPAAEQIMACVEAQPTPLASAACARCFAVEAQCILEKCPSGSLGHAAKSGVAACGESCRAELLTCAGLAANTEAAASEGSTDEIIEN